MTVKKTKKTVYEVRYGVGGGLSMKFDKYPTKAEAISAAKRASKQDVGRLYYVLRVSTEAVFFTGV
ncbi:MAG: hypothetical protein JRC53_05460 [Deltaproteobacteria bacterium]|nr:hypothetical protein [Deltaproteobacteria bacterium]